MRRAFVAASRATFNALYRITRKPKRDELVVFLSRQTNKPSYDFDELKKEFERRGYTCVMHLKKVKARNIIPYVAHVLRELRLLGRCKIAVLDRYDPVVSLLNFESEDYDTTACRKLPFVPRNLDFPKKPVVLQIWHAFGAYKKFGHQSVGTLEGHSASFTEVYDIHRNYSWVLCSGSGARDAFAEAFSCPPDRVIPLVRPEFDELLEARKGRKAHDADKPFTILMAPTLRKSKESAHPFRDLYQAREAFEKDIDADIRWSFHPLEQGLPAPGNVSSQLLEADCVVTDYSSIVYEAYVLGIPTVFYVPDLESYRHSPGLNADPQNLSPDLCMHDADELKAFLQKLVADPDTYPQQALESFAASGFDPDLESQPGTAASRIVDFALEQATGTSTGLNSL